MNFNTNNVSNNVSINYDKDCATRISQFNDAVVATNQSIKPGQLFSVKISENEKIWDGNLRIGFSILPDGILFPLPSFSIPDLIDRGGTWMWAISGDIEMEKGTQHETQSSFKFDRFQSTERCDFQNKGSKNECHCCLSTSYGTVPLYQLTPECVNITEASCVGQQAGHVGSIISIYYDVRSVAGCEFNEQCNILESPDSAGLGQARDASTSFDSLSFIYTFHIFLNGRSVNVHEDTVVVKSPSRSPFATTQSPYSYLPEMRAIVDVYGLTKSVQIVTFEQDPIKTLQDMCIHQMVKNSCNEHINRLPKSLREHLQVQLQKLVHLSQ